MLDSLNIKNYRNLKEIKIDSLKRVNLVIGKNNTGKSTILEALAIYATCGDFNMIYRILAERGENFERKDTNKVRTEINMQVFASLFKDRRIGFDATDAISIGNLDVDGTSAKKRISMRFVRYVDEVRTDDKGNMTRKRTIIQKDTEEQVENHNVGIEMKSENASYVLPLDEDMRHVSGLRFNGLGRRENVRFIRTGNTDENVAGELFDGITLTEKELYVVEALRIIEPQTERIAFVNEMSKARERIAVIKLSNSPKVLPLRSMGDGINRILTIILALVNADNGFLLIDEFENGLHHTVQERLWKIIFALSRKLNVQVFATTHSEDCIKGFENVLNDSGDAPSGKLIRLDNKNGKIVQVEFEAEELKVANEQDIDVR